MLIESRFNHLLSTTIWRKYHPLLMMVLSKKSHQQLTKSVDYHQMGEHQNNYPISRTPFKGDENMLRNSIDVKQKIHESNEESDCEIGSPLKQDGLSPLDSKGSHDASIEM